MSYDPGFDATIGALPLNVPQAPTGKHKLQLSHLKLTQLEMMGDDVDLTRFYTFFDGAGINMVGAMVDCTVERTVEGASTLTATITDENYNLLSSGLLSDQLTVEIDGLYWMLVTVKVDGPTVTLVFQEREIVIARRYDKPIKQSASTQRGTITRAQFALRLLREIKELPPIPYCIPALKVVQPLSSTAAWYAHNQQKTHQKGLGIPKHNNLTVQGGKMSPTQIRNADQILDTGASMALPRKYLVAAIMCTIQETGIHNLTAAQSPGGHVGCFQQDPAYWPASRDIPKDARAFYQRIGQTWHVHPDYGIAEAVLSVQNPGGKAIQYGRWSNEAERIIDAYGVVPGGQGSVADANNTFNFGTSTNVVYEFYRGRPPTSSYQKKHSTSPGWGKENTWDCWQRLASEVNWRCFFVSGTFYFISEEDLFRQKPTATIDDSLDGIDSISGTYDSQGHASDMTIQCRMGLWDAPPGSVIQLDNLGPWTGRWLVNDVQRSVFNSAGTITLKKPLPALPEPDSSNVSSASQVGNGKWSVGGKGTSGGPLGAAIVAVARQAENVPGASTSYLWGGPPGIGAGSHTDCSGFVLAVYAKAGVKPALPRTSQAQFAAAPKHPSSANLQPGDLVFFNYEGKHSHVGIYIGKGATGNGQYIGDQHTGSGIVTAAMDWSAYDGAGRWIRDEVPTGPHPGTNP